MSELDLATAAPDAPRASYRCLRDDPAVDLSRTDRAARVCIVSYEFVGPTRTGGIGTAYTSLAQALAADGHDVTVLFSGIEEPGNRPLSHWAAHYRKLGITLHGLAIDPTRSLEGVHQHLATAHRVYEWLRDAEREQTFDVIHFPEVLGHAYFTALAKRQGLAFQDATIVTGAHSSTSWVLETNGVLMQAPDDFVDDFTERRSVEYADVLISPSAYMLDWMRAKGWTFPERHFVQQYVRSAAVEELVAAAGSSTPAAPAKLTELVFFGRLEPRKGLHVFCDALDELASAPVRPERVHFLGKVARIDGQTADEYVEERAERWPWATSLVSNLNQPEAIAFLRGSGSRLTVIPSLADNSPNTVYEALALELPFIASRIGGTAELIDPRDLDRSTFDPGDPADARARAVGARDLAAHIATALASERFEPPRPAVAADACRQAHLDWHRAVAGAAGRERVGPDAAAPSVDTSDVSICVVGDNPDLLALTRATLPEAHEVVEARSHADCQPSGDLCLFVSAGIELEPGATAELARAMRASGASVVAPAVASESVRTLRLPVGGPPLAGLFRRCFGDGVFVVDRRAVEQLGGFDPRVPPGYQAHLLLCSAALAGMQIDPVPESLARDEPGILAAVEVVEQGRRIPALLDLYSGAPEDILRQLPLLTLQQVHAEGFYERAYIELYRNRFGGLTFPIRYVVHRIRRLQALARRILTGLQRR